MDARTIRRWFWGQLCDPYIGLVLIALALIAYGIATRDGVDQDDFHGLTRDHRRQCPDCAAAFARGDAPR